MKKYSYVELTDEDTAVEIIVTEEEILNGSWAKYTREKEKEVKEACEKSGLLNEPLTDKDIIEEFVACHWATEVKES